MSDDCSCELKIRVLSLDDQKAPAIDAAEFEAFLRDASRQLFGNVSGLIDFRIVDFDEGVVTLKTAKTEVTRLWSALTLYAPPHSVFTVARLQLSG